MVSIHRDGKLSPSHNYGYVSILIRPDRQFVYGNLLFDARALTYRIDVSREPNQLDIYDETGEDLLKKAIFSFSKGVLRICQASRGQERPSEFETKRDDGRILFLLKRKQRTQDVQQHTGREVGNRAQSP